MKTTFKVNEANLEAFLRNYYEERLPVVAITVEGAAKKEVPIRTGALQTDIKREVDVDNKVVFVGNDLDYSVWVNLGTRKKAPNPYLIRAMDGSIEFIKQIFGKK
jgi:hypothetical protein